MSGKTYYHRVAVYLKFRLKCLDEDETYNLKVIKSEKHNEL